jgi:hypothetical protein
MMKGYLILGCDRNVLLMVLDEGEEDQQETVAHFL